MTLEAQLDFTGSALAGTGNLVFPQQEGLHPNPASPRTGGRLSPAGGAVTSNKPRRSPGADASGISQLGHLGA